MKVTIRLLLVLTMTAAISAMGCSKAKIPEAMKVVPGDADIVATLDAKSLVAYAKKAMAKLVPAELKDKVPGFEVLAKQVMDMVGIDVNKLSNITFIGYAGSQDKMAVVAEGIDVKGLKGEKKGDHNGVALYALPEKVHYAELKGLGVVAGPSEEMIKKVLDASAGKVKRLADSERAQVMKELIGMEKNLDQLRLYLLTGDLPNAEGAPFKVKGGGLFLNLDKGVAGTVMSDEKGAGDLKNQLDMGMMGLQMAMASGGDMGMGVKMDDDTKKLVTDVLKNIKTDKSGNNVSVYYHGDLKPLIEKAVAMGMSSMTGGGTKTTAATDKDPIEKPAATPAKKPAADPDKAEKAAPAKP